jgi:hypothetical protein
MRVKWIRISTVCLALTLSACFKTTSAPTETFCAWSGPHRFSAEVNQAMTMEELRREAKHSCKWAKICKPRNRTWKKACEGVDDA